MRVFEAIARALVDTEVDTVFGVMGDGNMRHLSEFILSAHGRYVPSTSEGGAVGMADGYFRATRRVGVASITHGPAVTNALTALTEAVRSHSAVVVITADTPAQRFHLQELDLRAAARLTGADYLRVRSAAHAGYDLSTAVHQARQARRPVLLDIPIDLQESEIDYRLPRQQITDDPTVRASAGSLDRAIGLILSVRRPVIVAGRGAATPAAREAIIALADLLAAPLASTLLARDLFRGHPFDLGIFGTLATEIGYQTISDADCIIAFGAGLNPFTTAEQSLTNDKAIVRCDIDPSRISRHLTADVAIVADARDLATELYDHLKDLDRPASSLRSARLARRLREFAPAEQFQDSSTRDCIDMRTALIHLDARLPSERIVVTDAGRFCRAAWKYLRNDGPMSFFPVIGFGSVGLGTAAAIGASLGRPDVMTVVVVGDGGAMMAIAEFNTAVRQGLPLVLVVMNDGAYGAEYAKLKSFGIDPSLSLLRWPEFAELGRAIGGYGCTIREVADVEQAVAEIDAGHLPMVLDITCDPSIDVTAAHQG